MITMPMLLLRGMCINRCRHQLHAFEDGAIAQLVQDREGAFRQFIEEGVAGARPHARGGSHGRDMARGHGHVPR